MEKEFQTFVFSGKLSVDGFGEASAVRILRDTGASKSLSLDSVFHTNDDTFTGTYVLPKRIGHGVVEMFCSILRLFQCL